MISIMDEATGQHVKHRITPDELNTLSGVELAAMLLPDPTPADVKLINEFLKHRQHGDVP